MVVVKWSRLKDLGKRSKAHFYYFENIFYMAFTKSLSNVHYSKKSKTEIKIHLYRKPRINRTLCNELCLIFFRYVPTIICVYLEY